MFKPAKTLAALVLGASLVAAPSHVLAQAGQQQPAEVQTGQERIVLRVHTLKDKGMNNMDSHRVLAPEGWSVEGGGWWPAPQYFKTLPSQDIKVTAPDGRQVHVGPGLALTDIRLSPMVAQQLGVAPPREGSIDGGFLVMGMPDNLPGWQQWLQNRTLPQAFPTARNIRVTHVTVIPELMELMRRQLEPIRQQQAQLNQQMQMMGGGMSNFCDAAVLAAHCTYEMDGRQWEQLFIYGIAFLGTDSQMGRQIWWSVEPNIGFRAPAGQLDANMTLMMAIANSVAPTPEWARMKSDHIGKMNEISARGAAERSRIIAQSNREISRIINDGYAAHQRTMDETHRKVINGIRGVEEYVDPSQEYPVQLPQHYQHVFGSGNGEYILTNDPMYNPNADQAFNNRNWDPLKVYQPQQ